MDVIKSVQGYLNKMIQDVSGMKVLLLDGETTPIISMVVTQSQLLAREIFLIDRVDNRQKEKMKHLKCITFVRPTPESIQALVEELRDPCYGEYYLYFSNSLKKSAIERLAEVDEYEVVREVQEYYADFLAVNPDLFSLGLAPPAYSLYFENGTSWETKTFQRSTEGLVAILLALKKKPLIRYAKSSVLAKKLATEVMYQIQQEGPLFDFRRPDTAPILLILDRRQDPVTPLLSQWTYQALVHELLGITNGRVSLGDSPDRRPEMKEIVLNIEQDPFYKKCVFMNMGDLGGQIKEYVDEYQNKHKSSMNVESIADMKRFIDEYPEFKKLSGNVTKHVSLVSELSRLIERNSLLEVSELEQSLAVQENHSQDVKTLQKLIERPNVPVELKVRLVMLYALRYEKAANSMSGLLVEMLKKQGASEDQVLVASSIIQYAGSDQRQDDIFSNTDVFARTKQVFKGLKGIENVYTQHTPYLVETIESVIKGKTKEGAYPFVDGGTRDKPQDIIVFIVGGATYAEAREVSKINASNPGIRIVLGGTTIHNSSSYLLELADSLNRWATAGKAARISQTSAPKPLRSSIRMDP